MFSGLRSRVGGVAVAFAWTLAACGDAKHPATAASAPIVAVDDAGDTVRLARPAMRVISLIPSATETLIALGAADRIVGRTRYDVAKEVDSVPLVGGGIDPSIETVVSLKPDLVIGWDNDKRRDVRAKLLPLGIPVFSLRTEDTTDVFRGIASLGKLVGRDTSAARLSAGIRETLNDVHASVASRPLRPVMFVVYPDPPMTAGPHTFVDQLIGVAGGRSIFDDATALWPTVSLEEVVRRRPDLLIVPQGTVKDNTIEQFRARAGWRDLDAVKKGEIATVVADLVQRPGANIGEAAKALQRAIHPETVAK